MTSSADRRNYGTHQNIAGQTEGLEPRNINQIWCTTLRRDTTKQAYQQYRLNTPVHDSTRQYTSNTNQCCAFSNVADHHNIPVTTIQFHYKNDSIVSVDMTTDTIESSL